MLTTRRGTGVGSGVPEPANHIEGRIRLRLDGLYGTRLPPCAHSAANTIRLEPRQRNPQCGFWWNSRLGRFPRHRELVPSRWNPAIRGRRGAGAGRGGVGLPLAQTAAVVDRRRGCLQSGQWQARGLALGPGTRIRRTSDVHVAVFLIGNHSIRHRLRVPNRRFPSMLTRFAQRRPR